MTSLQTGLALASWPPRIAWGGVRRAVRVARRAQFGACGRDVRFDPWGVYAPAERMYFGPEFCVLGGDHNFGVPGKLMRDVRVGGRNLPVRIERDVWIGARVTLLKGYASAKGRSWGACSVVSKDIPPYVIALGHQSAPIRPRFSTAQLEFHLTSCDSPLSVADLMDRWAACGLDPIVELRAPKGRLED